MLAEQSVGCHLSYLIILFSFLSILQIGLFKAPKLHRLVVFSTMQNLTTLSCPSVSILP